MTKAEVMERVLGEFRTTVKCEYDGTRFSYRHKDIISYLKSLLNKCLLEEEEVERLLMRAETEDKLPPWTCMAPIDSKMIEMKKKLFVRHQQTKIMEGLNEYNNKM